MSLGGWGTIASHATIFRINVEITMRERVKFNIPEQVHLVPKGVHEYRTKAVENKVDDTLKVVVFLECAQC